MNTNPFDNIPRSHGCVLTDLEPGESPLFIARKHWIMFLQLGILVAVVVGICISIVLTSQFGGVPPIFSWLTALGSAMIGIQYIFVRWINDELDILVVTNKRVIEYDQIRFLDRKITQASIDQVQEVRASTSGLLGNLLRYGDMTIKTAGDASDFHLSSIPKALETSRIIHALIDEHRHELGNNK